MYKHSKINKILSNNRVFPKICIYIRKVTSMVKYFTEVRKTSEDVEVCVWRKLFYYSTINSELLLTQS